MSHIVLVEIIHPSEWQRLQFSNKVEIEKCIAITFFSNQGYCVICRVAIHHESIMETMDTYGHLFESNSASLAEKMDEAARKARSKKNKEMALVS